MKMLPHAISLALIGAGAAAFAMSARPLAENAEIDAPLNLLGINRSPYGEVIAMAMQGPVDTFFHAASAGNEKEVERATQDQSDPDSSEKGKDSGESLNDRLQRKLEELQVGVNQRTNSLEASAAHRFYLRRQVEDKLRFAYELDPSHYGNYNAYHFFLTQPSLGTRPELTPQAAELADKTIRYSLEQRNDPRQALTAAAAATNVLQLMFDDRTINPENPRYSIDHMKAVLPIYDKALSQYLNLSNEWEKLGVWENLSSARIAEMEERLLFVMKTRDAQTKAIQRIEQELSGKNNAVPKN